MKNTSWNDPVANRILSPRPMHASFDVCKNERIDIMADIVCYCFGYSEEDIRKEYEENGKSSILERIKAEKKFGNCQCATKNPTGK
jgi:hypothetical protein